jgi:predicted nucleotidyltransferase
MIVPGMGTKQASSASALASALFSPVQQRVLGLLFGQPGRRFQSAELIRLAGSGTGAVHRQLSRLESSGWVRVTRVGNQKYYEANADCPVYAELQGLIVKTVGLVEPLRRVLEPLADEIEAAFVYGSIAKGSDTADSDIDLLVISNNLSYPEIFKALESAETVLARPVNPNVMTPREWREKSLERGSFVARIATQPRLFVIGSDNELS